MKFTVHDNISTDQFRGFVGMMKRDGRVSNITVDEHIKACVVDKQRCYMFTDDTTAAGKVAARILVK